MNKLLRVLVGANHRDSSGFNSHPKIFWKKLIEEEKDYKNHFVLVRKLIEAGQKYVIAEFLVP